MLHLRPSGLPSLGTIPWGTHLCAFYQTAEELRDLLVDYFAAGLDANERCVWVTSPPLEADEALAAMRERIDGFDDLVAEERIKVVPHDEWYLDRGEFDSARVLAAWTAEAEEASRKGFDGLRITGNTAWLERRHWDAFAEYERAINHAVGDLPMLLL